MARFEQEALAAAPHSPLIGGVAWTIHFSSGHMAKISFMISSHTSTIYIYILLSNLPAPFPKRNSFRRCESSVPQRQIGIWLLCQTPGVKPTDKHQYLLKSSCHPSHTKQSIPLRLRRICSTDEFLNTRSGALTTRLIKRGNKHHFVIDAIKK